eukprot:GFKZ01015704.1.p1 GENE.GFKZ01015704.1~~GFKZ01015704.1.p1  ORF type:complete len:142 (-),score=7.46 GFKZ01015704.1:939-1364(-)
MLTRGEPHDTRGAATFPYVVLMKQAGQGALARRDSRIWAPLQGLNRLQRQLISQQGLSLATQLRCHCAFCAMLITVGKNVVFVPVWTAMATSDREQKYSLMWRVMRKQSGSKAITEVAEYERVSCMYIPMPGITHERSAFR